MLSPASPLHFKNAQVRNVAGGALSWKLRPKRERHNPILLFGSLKSGIEGSQKQHAWKEITAANSFSMDNSG